MATGVWIITYPPDSAATDPVYRTRTRVVLLYSEPNADQVATVTSLGGTITFVPTPDQEVTPTKPPDINIDGSQRDVDESDFGDYEFPVDDSDGEDVEVTIDAYGDGEGVDWVRIEFTFVPPRNGNTLGDNRVFGYTNNEELRLYNSTYGITENEEDIGWEKGWAAAASHSETIYFVTYDDQTKLKRRTSRGIGEVLYVAAFDIDNITIDKTGNIFISTQSGDGDTICLTINEIGQIEIAWQASSLGYSQTPDNMGGLAYTTGSNAYTFEVSYGTRRFRKSATPPGTWNYYDIWIDTTNEKLYQHDGTGWILYSNQSLYSEFLAYFTNPTWTTYSFTRRWSSLERTVFVTNRKGTRDLFITDYYVHTFLGKYYDSFAVIGQDSDGVYQTIASDSDGSIYLLEHGHGRLKKINKRGDTIWTLALKTQPLPQTAGYLTEYQEWYSTTDRIASSVSDAQGNIHLIWEKGEIWRVTADGVLSWNKSFPVFSGYVSAEGIFDADGNFYFEVDDTIRKIAPDGEILWAIENQDLYILGFCDGGVPPAAINHQGIDASVTTGAGYATPVEIITTPKATINYSGILPTDNNFSESRIVVFNPAVTNFDGAGLPSWVINTDPAETDHSSPVDSVAFTIELPAAQIEHSGIIGVASSTAYSFDVSPAVINHEAVPAVVSKVYIPVFITGRAYLAPAAEIGHLGITPAAISSSNLINIYPSAAQIDYSGILPLFVSTMHHIEVVPAVINHEGSASLWIYWAVLPGAQYHIVYRCTLTGTPDLTLPISTFQARLRDGTPAYLQVTVPNAADYINDVQDRADGEIVVEKGLRFASGYTQYEELGRVDFDALAYDRGPFNYTMTLSGNKTTTNTAPKTVTLTDVSGVSLQANGLRRVKCGVDFFARPGDTVTWDNTSITAGLITITVGRGTAYMDITEAET